MIPDLTFEAKHEEKSQKKENEDDNNSKKSYNHGQARECTSINSDVVPNLETKISEEKTQSAKTSNSASNSETLVSKNETTTTIHRTNSFTFGDNNAKPKKKFGISAYVRCLNETDDDLHDLTKNLQDDDDVINYRELNSYKFPKPRHYIPNETPNLLDRKSVV